ncbi:MAG: YajQ family cyclic di-GMP-binding protein [Candidatus Nanopelagicales bacterium]
MAADNSFDIVSKIDRQEADNALNQAGKELSQRFDFKNTETKINWSGEMGVEIESSTEERVIAALVVFKEKLGKRSISLKAFKACDPKSSGKVYKIQGTFNSGISQEQAKKVTKLIRDEGPKSVKTQIMGEEVRVSSKSRDDLQATIDLVKNADLDFATQFVNYR